MGTFRVDITARVAAVENKTADLASDIAEIGAEITDVQIVQSTLTENVSDLKDFTAQLDEDLDELGNDFMEVEGNLNALTSRVTVLENDTPTSGYVMLDSFTGTDDEKLTAALNYIGQQSSKLPLLFSPRPHRFTVAGRKLFSGARIDFGAPDGLNTLEISGTVPYWIEVACPGPWWDTTGQDLHSITLSNLAAHYTNGAYFFRNNYGTGGTAPYPITFHHMSHFGGAGGFGTSAEKCTFTQASFTGLWSTQGFTDTPYHLGGADMRLWLDSNHNIESQQVGSKPVVWCDYLSNTTFGPLYVTTPKGWRGILVTGSVGTTKGCALTFMSGGVSEGHNQDSLPAYGTLLRVQGGSVAVNNMKIARPLAQPNVDEKAGIQIDGGNVLINGIFYDRGTRPVTDPVVWVNSGTLRIGGVQSINDEPMTVHRAGGTVEITDSSCTLA